VSKRNIDLAQSVGGKNMPLDREKLRQFSGAAQFAPIVVESELEPLLQVVLLSHSHQVVVVVVSIALKKIRKIKYRLSKDFLAHQI
jgi:hypothetical protein